jgi:23S rRNA (adenine2030-N6)-methyltransferase
MNYRHAFHAGNFADCMKHALLVVLIRALLRKPAAFCVLDTHAGIGQYDLTGPEATRSGEWQAGIQRLREMRPAALGDYLALVDMLGLYPGSPRLVRALLRPQDRLICCELHPDDAKLLRRHFAADRQVSVHHRDGREAIVALLPPAERRGLVLFDPPYEDPDEYDVLVKSLTMAQGRFRNGIFAAWYPIKHLGPVHDLHHALQASPVRDIVAAELHLRAPTDPARLNGCGLIVVNPPYGFTSAATTLLDALATALAEPGEGASRLLTLVAE